MSATRRSLDLFFFYLIRRDAEGPEKPAVISGDIEGAPCCHHFGGRGNLGNRAGSLFAAIHEPDDRFEGDAHLEPSDPGLFATRFHLRIIGDCCGNGVGELASQPIDDVIHVILP